MINQASRRLHHALPTARRTKSTPFARCHQFFMDTTVPPELSLKQFIKDPDQHIIKWFFLLPRNSSIFCFQNPTIAPYFLPNPYHA
tara:strand:- start:1500 stop:1757 length:258 start_codon:yes stop_codon:yes gene_type:complete